jgi:hypothetical protein
MAALTRFEELFGDESSNFATTPTLYEVVPEFIEADSKYASKELNRRRKAVTGRSFRSPNPRSYDPRKPEPQQTQQAPNTDTIERFNPIASPPDHGGGPGANYSGIEGDTDGLSPASTAAGDAIASQLGTYGAASAVTTGIAGLGLGFGVSDVAPAMLESFVTTALNPVTVANTVGGGITSGIIGHGLGEEAAIGGSQNPIGVEAAVNAAQSPLGLIGQTAEAIASMFGIGQSPVEQAEFAFNQAAPVFAQHQHAMNQQLETTIANQQSDSFGLISNPNAPADPANLDTSIAMGFGEDMGDPNEGIDTSVAGGFNIGFNPGAISAPPSSTSSTTGSGSTAGSSSSGGNVGPGTAPGTYGGGHSGDTDSGGGGGGK